MRAGNDGGNTEQEARGVVELGSGLWAPGTQSRTRGWALAAMG